MTGKRKSKGGHQKSYRGPWPEDHGAKFSGRRSGEDRESPRVRTAGAPAQPKVQKIPQNTPK